MFKLKLRTILILLTLIAAWIHWNEDLVSRWVVPSDQGRLVKAGTIDELESVIDSSPMVMINVNYLWSIDCALVSKSLTRNPRFYGSYPFDQFEMVEFSPDNLLVTQELEKTLARFQIQEDTFTPMLRMNTRGLILWKVGDRLYVLDDIRGFDPTIKAAVKKKAIAVLAREGKRKRFLELFEFTPWVLLAIGVGLWVQPSVRRMFASDDGKNSTVA